MCPSSSKSPQFPRAKPHRRPEKIALDRTDPKLSSDGLPEVSLIRRGVERWQKGHPWIYRADLNGDPGLQGGEVVRVTDSRGWFLGKAFYSKASKISLRWLSLEDVAIDAKFFAERIRRADELRSTTLPGQTTYRAIHGEADLLPGLVVDRYGDYLSIQFLVKATEERKAMLLELLVAHFKPKGCVNRSDVSVRLLEGLTPEKGVLYGEVPTTVPIAEGSVQLQVDLLGGQKTGTFLDQRDNHLMAAEYAFGETLDCFSYLGGFALQLAQKATQVTAVEISNTACAQIVAHASSNGLANLKVIEANVFDYLRDTLDEGKKFDTIVLDPPSFAKNKDAIASAIRGYKEINLRAMQLLRPGGYLITASCTYHIDELAFEEMLHAAASDAKKQVQIIERRGAGKDHPVLLNLRETRYLKCYVLRVF